MAKRSPETFIKRQREMDKKRKASEKRKRRAERKDNEGSSEVFLSLDELMSDQIGDE